MHPAIYGLLTIVIGVGACVAYFFFSNQFLDKVLFPATGPNAGRNINRANMVRPWLFLMPALAALGLYLAYPVFETFRLSLLERSGADYVFVGAANYERMMGDPKFWEALRNNMLWLIIVPAFSTAFGLLAAQLTDRLSWGSIAKSLIFMPMAISFVGASVIWKLVYDARPEGEQQIGVMNAVWTSFTGGPISILLLKILPLVVLIAAALAILIPAARGFFNATFNPETAADMGQRAKIIRIVFGLVGAILAALCLHAALGVLLFRPPYGEPQTWLTVPFWNSFLLMVVLIWIQTGFAMVILSAALRGIPEETIEAAIVDGAPPLKIFFQIKVPQIMGTIVVVWTTITIVVLKVFDIVFAMTNGQWGTQVLANYMYSQLFVARDWGVGSASAMVIMLLVTPILVWNVYNVRKEMR